MNGYLSATVVLVLGGSVVLGATAAATGWLLPWLRSRTPRPALWGYGTMLFGTGLLLSMSYGSFGMLDGSPSGVIDVAFVASLLMIAVGGYLQVLSSRPRVHA